MNTLSASELRKDISAVLNRVAYGGERIAVHRHGKAQAVLISVEDYGLLRELEDRIDLEEIEAARKEVAEEGTVPWDEVKTRAGL